MVKFVADIIKDKGLEYFGERAALGHVKLALCAGAPATYGEADAAADGTAANRKTGEQALGESDFALDDGAPSGRKVTIAAQDVLLSYPGPTPTTDHAVILDTEAQAILAYSDIEARAAPTGDRLLPSAWSITITDPA